MNIALVSLNGPIEPFSNGKRSDCQASKAKAPQ